MKLVINPNFKELEAALLKLPILFEHEGHVLYKSRNELRTIDLPGLTINVKRYQKPILMNRIAYSFFRKSKARRAYEYALILREKGFDTPEPIAYLEFKSLGLLHYSYFVATHLHDFRMIREFADGSEIEGREDIIESLGVFIAKLHQAGILHLDLSVGNILFQKVDQKIHFWLVDLNRMRFCEIDQKKGCKNFERLRGSKAFFEVLSRAYANERGFDPAECLDSILTYQQKSVKAFRIKSNRKKRLRKMKIRR
ncbi:MAG TPA: lipopolysaccharide kinase InaA family protein [Bacteroidales bacterium]|nr:lipopolysaccharide kinase InaA family protein [Bacteroidales bacterium]